ncbi:MAG TPA: VWA domain-containing protein [Gaiellaceae bacterium]|nr:VWA domain-containing protein [Gaiellaceae bacterium]
MLALFGVSFLTPLDGLFVLVAAVPLAALFVTERRSGRIRRAFGLIDPNRLTLAPVALSLVLLPALIAVAATQPVVVHQHLVNDRADAQAFYIFDTSLSMQASSGPGKPSRLARAKRLALRLRATMPDVPIGIASMTDRSLPNLMPTTDARLFQRTLGESVAIDSPPPSQPYQGRATEFQALAPVVAANFFPPTVARKLVVVFTDGEAQPISPILGLTLQRRVAPIYVHVWAPGELLYDRRHHKADPGYRADPTSTAALAELARLTSGQVFNEDQLSKIARASRNAVGYGGTVTHVDAYARVALAPWFVLGGVLPLGFLFWRRNF